jgi:hypothetical protein
MVESRREIGDKLERETRFYITSLAWLAAQVRPVVRAHWAIENSLRMGTGHDLPRRRVPRAYRSRPRQFHHHQAHGPQLDPRGARKGQLPPQAKNAAWDDDFLASLIAAA